MTVLLVCWLVGIVGSPAAARPPWCRSVTIPPYPPPEDFAKLLAERPLLGRLAAGEKVTAADLKVLYGLLDREGTATVVSAWALGKAGNRAALPALRRRYRHLMCRPGFEPGVGGGLIRVAELRLSKMGKRQARQVWARLLRSDPNPLVRAEAAEEVVAAGHPRALELLRAAIAEAKSKRGPLRAEIMAQAAAALGRLGRQEAIDDLKGLLGIYDDQYDWAYGVVLALQVCHTFRENRCAPLLSVDSHARRALEKLTGKPWPEPRGRPREAAGP